MALNLHRLCPWELGLQLALHRELGTAKIFLTALAVGAPCERAVAVGFPKKFALVIATLFQG